MANSADSDQLAEANWSGSTLFPKAGYVGAQHLTILVLQSEHIHNTCWRVYSLKKTMADQLIEFISPPIFFFFLWMETKQQKLFVFVSSKHFYYYYHFYPQKYIVIPNCAPHTLPFPSPPQST